MRLQRASQRTYTWDMGGGADTESFDDMPTVRDEKEGRVRGSTTRAESQAPSPPVYMRLSTHVLRPTKSSCNHSVPLVRQDLYRVDTEKEYVVNTHDPHMHWDGHSLQCDQKRHKYEEVPDADQAL